VQNRIFITYSFEIDGIDWAALKADLAADDFDNGRTPEQYRLSAEGSAHNCFAYDGNRIIGTVRALSDGVGNAYIVDVWTQSAYRNQGVARRMMELTLARMPGQHVYLFTDDDTIGFYDRIGFKRQGIGVLSGSVGNYLSFAGG
jgi:ribosomal protein S18 acetylase RimI-like enzyme